MARALWSGSISFGLVNVPVALLAATQDKAIHFHQVHEKNHQRLRIKRVCSKDGKEVAWDHIAHGYDVDGEMVMLTDEELDRLAPRRSKTVDIEAFAARDEVDPALLDHPYLLVPRGSGEGSARAYALLVSVMEGEDSVAIGRFVLRTREHIAAIYVRDGVLALSTMLFADELRDPDSVGEARATGRAPKKAVDALGDLVDALSTDWDPEQYPDRHRKRVQKLIADKRKGGEIEVPEGDPEQPEVSSDLIASLTESLEKVRAGSTS